MSRIGIRASRAYIVWKSMRRRCRNPGDISYPWYGGRGIKICERWESFENFFADMGEPPPRHQIDRIDSNGHYEPGNCRWVTKIEQANNQSNNHPVTFGGETLNINQWARRLGIKRELIKSRLRRGWSVEDTLTKPVTSCSENGRNVARKRWTNPDHRAAHSAAMRAVWAARKAAGQRVL
jgi:hypothetical protein